MKNSLLLLFFTLFAATTYGQAVSWELSAQPGDQVNNPATLQGANFDNCVLSRGAGIAASTGAGSMNASGWFSGTTPTTLANAIAGNDYYEFTINTINCLFFNPTTIKIVLRSSATGPSMATLRCSSDGFTSDIGTVTVGTASAAFTFSETISPNSQSVTYRLYGYGSAAGGGTPSSGGTMRIGSSVVAADNDLEVFATTTFVSVGQVSNITVTDGDAVPATILTANVPGATVNWSRTPETIGLGATSGTGNVPAFTAFNASGSPVTSTFTVNATVGNCTGPDMIFTITVNPNPCTISVSFFGNPSACNDNGTPNDPGDDFFTQNVHASFFNRPLTGSLQIVPGGDQIGTYSIPVNQIIGNAHTFNNVMLKADGTPTVVQMNFTDDPACIDAATGPTVQPCSTPPPACTITVDFFGNPSACNDNGTPNDPGDDFFTQNIHASFFNRPLTGSLQIVPGGDQIGTYSIPVNQIIGNAHTFNNVMLKADGTPTVVQMNFTDDPACIDAATGPTVQPCSSGQPCEVIGMVFNNIGACDDNGTPGDSNDDFFPTDVEVLFANPPATGNLTLNGAGMATPVSVPVGSLSGGSHTFVNAHLVADGNANLVTATFSANPACTGSTTTPAVNDCSNGAPACSITNLEIVNVEACDDNGTPGDPTDDFYIADILVSFVNPPATGSLTISGSDLVGGSFAAAVANVLSVGSPFPFSNKKLKADGQSTSVVAEFTGAPGCIAGMSTLAGVDPCSFPAPVLTCPPPITVSCASQVPPIDPASVGVTHDCPGNVTVVGVTPEFITDQVCANKFNIFRAYNASDECGNLAQCSQFIQVNDQTNPTITCPPNVTVSCANQVASADINAVTGESDNCGGVVTVSNFPADAISNQTCPNRFTITRSYFAIDACGNSANCIQTITVNDQTPPNLTCPVAQTVSCGEQVPAPNTALVTGLSDNCSGTATPSFFSDAVGNQTCANRFIVTRQYRATDACGNTRSCTQVITVNDQTPPTFTSVPANVTVDCHVVPGAGIATASDNCTSGASVTFLGEVKTPGICPVLFRLTRTWRATDVCGNSATATQVVTVTDTYGPQFTVDPADVITECSAGSVAEFQAWLNTHGGAEAEDCTEITWTFAENPLPYTASNCGNTFEKWIRFTATDTCGNASFRDAWFYVIDQTPPAFTTPPQHVILECNAYDDGEVDFYNWLDNNAWLVVEDNCGGVTLEKLLWNETQGCGKTWSKTYQFRATDECGNVSTSNATFAVADNTPPTVVCQEDEYNVYPCIENVPAANPAAVSAWDCNEVVVTLADTWTVGTGCPNWMMTVAYRYAATDACGNVAICEQLFQVQETDTPVLVCPDTIVLACVNDIPGPQQLFAYLKNLLSTDCAGGFTSVTILSDSGQPQTNTHHRSYTFTAKNRCGLVTAACTVTFNATGNCNELCTAPQSEWGDPAGSIGGMNTTDAIMHLIQVYGPVTVGGGYHTVSAPFAACLQELLEGAGSSVLLPPGNYTCPLPPSMTNPDGSLNNRLAANAMALQLNIWYNREFNNRDLGVQDLNNLPPCLIEYALFKELAQNPTVQDLLDLTNEYLQGYAAYYAPDLPDLLNAALENLNYFRVDCELNAPCERPEGPMHRRINDREQTTATRIFPNPATEAATLVFWSDKAEEVRLKITDVRGVGSLHTFQAAVGRNTRKLLLSQFPSGIYWVSLQRESGQEILRLVKSE